MPLLIGQFLVNQKRYIAKVFGIGHLGLGFDLQSSHYDLQLVSGTGIFASSQDLTVSHFWRNPRRRERGELRSPVAFPKE